MFVLGLSKFIKYSEKERRVKEYIKNNLSDAINISEIAEVVHLSPDYLTKIFKKECNITLIEYIIQQRMFLAKELLTNSKMSISRVADKTGYTNYSYFSKAFKKYYGISPREMQINSIENNKK